MIEAMVEKNPLFFLFFLQKGKLICTQGGSYFSLWRCLLILY